ncbi:unnamed protein product [Caenorhabditis auriculariae]|uniref:Uncharacterized protein n=1 Tax=Caenorhabditis auriculariae TaxID=2777116 RepID=A0A8S1HA20_9PELO|nr:unnamed protein product [Caenorhabditis auriculariae]
MSRSVWRNLSAAPYGLAAFGWRAFAEKENGETDKSIVVFKCEKPLPKNFEPFNIDRYLAEKILKELDIDPKYAIF